MEAGRPCWRRCAGKGRRRPKVMPAWSSLREALDGLSWSSALDGGGRGVGHRTTASWEDPIAPLLPTPLDAPCGRHLRAAAAAGFLSARPRAASFVEQGPTVSGVKLRLIYQSPEIYRTDIAEPLPQNVGYKYSCKFATANESGLGEQDYVKHPSIVFNKVDGKKANKVHVKMVDTETGDVYWDCVYKLSGFFRKKLGNSAMAEPPGSQCFFRNPCVRETTLKPKLFDISIQTMDGFYEDWQTPWGDNEGFMNFRGPKAHIGVEAFREAIVDKDGHEVLDTPGPGKRVAIGADGPIHQNRQERILAGEENGFANDSPGAGMADTGRGYYWWVIKKEARDRNNRAYLQKFAPPLLLVASPPEEAPASPAKTQ